MGNKNTAFVDFQINGNLSGTHSLKEVEEWIHTTNLGIFFDRYYNDIRKIHCTDLIFPDQETKTLFKLAFNIP